MTGSLRSLCMTSAFGLFRGLWLQEHLQNIVWYSYIPLSSLPCIATIQLRCRRNDRTVGLQQMSRFSSFHLSFHHNFKLIIGKINMRPLQKSFHTQLLLMIICELSLWSLCLNVFCRDLKIIVLPK